MARTHHVVVGFVALGLVACSKDVAPTVEAAYLAAAEARANAICDCTGKDDLECVSQMEERYALVPPPGESIKSYESKLEPADHAKLIESEKRAAKCAVTIRLSHHVAPNAR